MRPMLVLPILWMLIAVCACASGVSYLSTQPHGPLKPHMPAMIIRHYLTYFIYIYVLHIITTLLFYAFMRTKSFRMKHATSKSTHLAFRSLPYVIFPIYIIAVCGIIALPVLSESNECTVKDIYASKSDICYKDARCYPEYLRTNNLFTGINCKTIDCARKKPLAYENNGTLMMVKTLHCIGDNSWIVNGWKVTGLKATCVDDCDKCSAPTIFDCQNGQECLTIPSVSEAENMCSRLKCDAGIMMKETGTSISIAPSVIVCNSGNWVPGNTTSIASSYHCSKDCNNCNFVRTDTCLNQNGWTCDKNKIITNNRNDQAMKCQFLSCSDGMSLMYFSLTDGVLKPVDPKHRCSPQGWIDIDSTIGTPMHYIQVTCVKQCDQCTHELSNCPKGFLCDSSSLSETSANNECKTLECTNGENMFYMSSDWTQLESGQLTCESDSNWISSNGNLSSPTIVCGKDCGKCNVPEYMDCKPGYECASSFTKTDTGCFKWSCTGDYDLYYMQDNVFAMSAGLDIVCDSDRKLNIDGKKIDSVKAICAKECSKCMIPASIDCPNGYGCQMNNALKHEKSLMNSCDKITCSTEEFYYRNGNNQFALTSSAIQCDKDMNWHIDGTIATRTVHGFCGKKCVTCQAITYTCPDNFICTNVTSIQSPNLMKCDTFECPDKLMYYKSETGTLSSTEGIIQCYTDGKWHLQNSQFTSLSAFCGKDCNKCKVNKISCKIGYKCPDKMVETPCKRSCPRTSKLYYFDSNNILSASSENTVQCGDDFKWNVGDKKIPSLKAFCGQACNHCPNPVFECPPEHKCSGQPKKPNSVCVSYLCDDDYLLYYDKRGFVKSTEKLECGTDGKWKIGEQSISDTKHKLGCGIPCNRCPSLNLSECPKGYLCQPAYHADLVVNKCRTYICREPNAKLHLVNTDSITVLPDLMCDTDGIWKTSDNKHLAADAKITCGNDCSTCPALSSECPEGYNCQNPNPILSEPAANKCKTYTCPEPNEKLHLVKIDSITVLPDLVCDIDGIWKTSDNKHIAADAKIACGNECPKCDAFPKPSCPEYTSCRETHVIKTQESCYKRVCLDGWEMMYATNYVESVWDGKVLNEGELVCKDDKKWYGNEKHVTDAICSKDCPVCHLLEEKKLMTCPKGFECVGLTSYIVHEENSEYRNCAIRTLIPSFWKNKQCGFLFMVDGTLKLETKMIFCGYEGWKSVTHNVSFTKYNYGIESDAKTSNSLF